jgi:putative mRNA 3-end processing factor
MKKFICFDPSRKRDPSTHFFISHAHSDHLGGLRSKGKGYLTSGTKDILSSRGEVGLANFSPLTYGDKVEIDGLEIIVHNAGHMLGSAQYEIKSPETTMVYTGDINYRDMLTTKAAETISCDILILEATYGNPRYIFPDPIETYAKMIYWTIDEIRRKNIPVFKVYSAGKAQEVIKILNNFTELPVITHPSVTRVSEAYVKNGVDLKYIDVTVEEGKEILQSRECAFIAPPRGTIPNLKRYSLAAATGWSMRFKMNDMDAVFPLSSHADFNQLVNCVEAVRPKEVFTVYGFKEFFARYLYSKLGVKARPLAPMRQKYLREFL